MTGIEDLNQNKYSEIAARWLVDVCPCKRKQTPFLRYPIDFNEIIGAPNQLFSIAALCSNLSTGPVDIYEVLKYA